LSQNKDGQKYISAGQTNIILLCLLTSKQGTLSITYMRDPLYNYKSIELKRCI
jgi:hypothetical protein